MYFVDSQGNKIQTTPKFVKVISNDEVSLQKSQSIPNNRKYPHARTNKLDDNKSCVTKWLKIIMITLLIILFIGITKSVITQKK